MELHPTTFPESLKATLNCYQLTSIDSLSGPSGFPALAAQMWFKENKQLPPIPPQPLLPMPYLMQNDKSVKRSETNLAGEKIACFLVGGEKRLCLPQILTSVLREYSIAEINQACAELHIYCSRCLPEQLEILKVMCILPLNTAQCGLITKTDAERLVALLTDSHEPSKPHHDRLPKDVDPSSGFHVYHECFGKGYGKFYPDMYASPNSQCIICEDCGNMYSPQSFIAHSHRSYEKRTCHWGFDPENWRHYLLLPKNIEGSKKEELEKVLDKMKARFETPRYDVPGQPPLSSTQYPSTANNPSTPAKRRYESEQESPICKKIKEENTKIYEANLLTHPYASLPYGVPGTVRHSAFRPWSPGLTGKGGSNPSDNPVIQDLSHLKGLLPLGFDRRGFPYLQNGRPVVLGSRVSEYSLPPPGGSTRIAASEDQNRVLESRKSDSSMASYKSPTHASSVDKDNNNNHDNSAPRGMFSKEDPRKHLVDRSPHERSRKVSVSPSRPHLSDEFSPRSRSRLSPNRYAERPRSQTSQLSSSSPTRSTSLSNVSNNPREQREEYEIARPISRSRAAAATAMLELKSAGSFRTGGAPLPRMSALSPSAVPSAVPSSGEKCEMLPTPNTPTTKAPTPMPRSSVVVPLDSSLKHYKWTIGGHSYIVSAAGFQSLEMLRSLLESECSNGSGKDRILHEMVKMKSLFEEKLDIEMRVRRDLEMELEHLKAAQREKQQSTTDVRKLMRQDMENMRQEHLRRMQELLRSHDCLAKQLEDSRRGLKSAEKEESRVERELEELRSRIRELETKNDKLHSNLVDEREKREDAELKLQEASDSSRGRISLFMESPLSRMMRGVGRRSNEDEGGKPPPPPVNSNKKVTSLQGAYPPPSSISTIPFSQLNGGHPSTPMSMNGQITVVHGKSPPGCIDGPKTVVVS